MSLPRKTPGGSHAKRPPPEAAAFRASVPSPLPKSDRPKRVPREHLTREGGA